ncbi:MAG: hypothetical protein ACYC6T_16220 [Thermoleophilia bacterium]
MRSRRKQKLLLSSSAAFAVRPRDYVSKSGRSRGSAAHLVQLTAQERDLLLDHVHPPGALDHLAPRTPQVSPVVTLQLDAEELAEFMLLFENTANSAQDLVAMDRLTSAYSRVEAGLEGDVDPGAHLLRPAATTRTAGAARSIELLVPPEAIPALARAGDRRLAAGRDGSRSSGCAGGHHRARADSVVVRQPRSSRRRSCSSRVNLAVDHLIPRVKFRACKCAGTPPTPHVI